MQLVFLVGAPRSGTTWLQLMLFQHPQVATSQETHLFDWYIAKQYDAWKQEEKRPDPRGGGLRGVLTNKEFLDLLGGFAGGVFTAIAAHKPRATVLLEKTPGHTLHWALIHRLFPEARFIHLIRDPRAVVASLKRAGATWGSHWAPTSAIDGARQWADAVSRRAAMRDVLGDLYIEVRYEDLRRDPVNQVHTLHGWLGIETDAAIAAAAVAACEADKLQKAADEASAPWALDDEPAGFYRNAPADQWRNELRQRDIKIVEFINQTAMNELGYSRTASSSRRKPITLTIREGIDTNIARLARVIKRHMPWLLRIAERAIRE